MLVMSKKISIIVPVYNAEKYLPRCLDSILAQTFADFELLLIDDGSKDRSGTICDEYAQKDCRIRVFHKNNGGVSTARNLGIDKAKGEWVAFIDSDDYVSPTYLTNFVKHIACEKQIILTGYDIVGQGKPRKLENKNLTGKDFVIHLIKSKVIFHSQPWAKLFNLKVINDNGIRFPLDVNLGEDAIFNLKYYCQIDRFTQSATIDYHYEFSNENSLTGKIFPFQSEWTTFCIWEEYLSQLLQRFTLNADLKYLLWNNGIGNQFTRCLKAIYDKRNGYSHKAQLTYLHGIPYETYRGYCTNYRSRTIKQEINKFLISKKLFELFYITNKFFKNRQ